MSVYNCTFHNINILSQSANRSPEAFSIEEKEEEDGSIHLSLKPNDFITEMYLRAKNFLFGRSKEYKDLIAFVIEANVTALNNAPESAFVNEAKSYTDLFLAAQRFNHSVKMAQDKTLKNSVPLFKKLSLSTFINFPEAQPIQVASKKIEQNKLPGIPPEQEPYIIKKGLWHKHKAYHYNEADTKISHGKEAVNIFLGTQGERLLSLIGRIVESIAKCFGKKVIISKNITISRMTRTRKGIFTQKMLL